MKGSPVTTPTLDTRNWLQRYYFVRAGVGALWAVAAFTVGPQSAAVAAVLLVVYPAWDAAANYVDAARSGGLSHNRTQTVNLVVSLVTTVAVAAALLMSPHSVLYVFGVWASLAGLLQLATAVRRWRTQGAQWAMILSGGQSAIVGALFVWQAQSSDTSAIGTAAGYAAMGAFYFLVSAVWLTVKARRG
jgi:uncharacterized membrane protein HdeD (DUF308 family)